MYLYTALKNSRLRKCAGITNRAFVKSGKYIYIKDY